jgi:hypothetical protein
MCEVLVSNSHRMQFASFRKSNWSVLCSEIMALFCENYAECVNMLYGQNAVIFFLKLTVHFQATGPEMVKIFILPLCN